MNGYKILNRVKYFYSGILQNYLIFLSTKKYFRFFTNISQALSWKSKGFLEESIENIITSDSNFAATLINHYALSVVKFNGHCLITSSTVSIKIINLYISYTLDRWSRDLNTDFTLNNC